MVIYMSYANLCRGTFFNESPCISVLPALKSNIQIEIEIGFGSAMKIFILKLKIEAGKAIKI